MNDAFWNWILGRYPAIEEESTLDRNSILKLIEDVYGAGYTDGQSDGYEDGYNDCLDENGLDG